MTEQRKEAVDHPAHYGGEKNPYEAIKVIEAWSLDFCLGNAVKYISRAGKKDDSPEIQDLKKAAWYLQRRIEQIEQRVIPNPIITTSAGALRMKDEREALDAAAREATDRLLDLLGNMNGVMTKGSTREIAVCIAENWKEVARLGDIIMHGGRKFEVGHGG